jgi:hypothetical protein
MREARTPASPPSRSASAAPTRPGALCRSMAGTGRGSPLGRGRLGHRRVTPHRLAGGPCALGAGARPRGLVPTAGAAVHGPRRRSGRGAGLVRAPLGHRGHLRRGALPLRRGNPAPVVGQGRRPHHAGAARPVLPGGAPDARPARARHAHAPACRLVPQGGAHVQRHACRGPALALGREGAPSKYKTWAAWRRPGGAARLWVGRPHDGRSPPAVRARPLLRPRPRPSWQRADADPARGRGDRLALARGWTVAGPEKADCYPAHSDGPRLSAISSMPRRSWHGIAGDRP